MFDSRGALPSWNFIEHCVEIHVLVCSEFIIHAGILEDDAEALPDFVLLSGRVEAIDFNASAGRLQQRGKNFNGCGFSRSIRTEKREDLALLNFKRDIADGANGTEGFHQIMRSDHVGSVLFGCEVTLPDSFLFNHWRQQG